MGTERCGPNPPAGYDFLFCFEWVRELRLGGGGVRGREPGGGVAVTR
jgi:hypothetical protein